MLLLRVPMSDRDKDAEILGCGIRSWSSSGSSVTAGPGSIRPIGPCGCRECHPCWSSSMLVFVEDPAESITGVESLFNGGSVVGSGSARRGRVLAMPRWGRC